MAAQANPLGYGALSASFPGGAVHPMQGVITGGAAGTQVVGGVPPTLGEDKPGCDYKLGYISHMFLEKGYSLMTTKTQTMVLVSRNIIEPSKLVMNEAVAVRVQLNPEGQLFAVAPLYRIKGEVKAGMPIQFGDYHGLVKHPQKNGDCFVDCEEVKAKHQGRDAYIHSSVVQQCELNQGDGICFTLHMNKAGMPQVPMPVWRICKQGAGTISGELDQEIHFGWVTDVNEEHSTITSNTHGKLMAVTAVVDPKLLNVGELVAFGLRQRPNNMMPDRVDPPFMKFCGQPSKSSWACFGEYIGKIGDDAEAIMAMAAGQGTFVQCLAVSEQFGRDVYAHTAVLQECGLVAGDIICFKVHINKKGWPQLTAPVWKILSPEKASSTWVKCDKIRPGSAVKLPGQAATTPMLPMEKVKGASKGCGWGVAKGMGKQMAMGNGLAINEGMQTALAAMAMENVRIATQAALPPPEPEAPPKVDARMVLATLFGKVKAKMAAQQATVEGMAGMPPM